eukprot:TRINITY_DN2180_c1_g2_i4.p1 TRINITY_DN2180_c1_g2~~TRINITY_DN2180_c1_g2_i4.p1  ORF type:complete len:219 (+),score=16.52 TRINITY_DN2180_c1_g2_i4:119-775(+)
MFVKLVLFVLVLHMREMRFHDDFGEEQIEENSQRHFGRRISQMSACGAQKSLCVDGCKYQFVTIECRSTFNFPGPNVVGGDVGSIQAQEVLFLISFRKLRVDKKGAPITGCKQHFCGGVLVWHDVVLTAAHCLKGFLEETNSKIQQFNQEIWATRSSKCRHQDGKRINSWQVGLDTYCFTRLVSCLMVLRRNKKLIGLYVVDNQKRRQDELNKFVGLL